MQTITNCFFIPPIASLIQSYYTSNGKEPHCNDIEGVSTDTNEVNNNMVYACKEGHMALVEKMIACGASDWNSGLARACKGSNMEVVEKMIACGADNWNWGLRGACYEGNMALVEKMIECGATDLN